MASSGMQHTCSEDCSNIPQFREYPFPQKLLTIPNQAQKGFTNIPISFTCLDACEDYLAIGSNVGVVYLYDWKSDNLHKLKNNDHTNPITCVKILVSLECMVVFGCKKGTVIVFKIPLNNEDQVEKFTVEGLHQCSVTALEWVRNGIRFFSGDANGVIVSTEIEHFEHQSRSKILLEEKSEVVQLNYQNKVLLVSTLQRAFLYSVTEDKVIQVGQKDRKCLGKFGAVFFDVDGTTLYASRPGQRLWKSDFSGVVSETIVLKSALSNAHHSSSIRRNSVNSGVLKDVQFSVLTAYAMKYLLTWSECALVFINPQLQTVASIQDFYSIVGVACRNDEIFILQGIRHLIRLCVHVPNETHIPEAEPASLLQEFLVPLKEFSSKSSSKSANSESGDSPNVFNWLKRKFSDVSLNTLDDPKTSENGNIQEVASMMPTLPDVIQLDSNLIPINTDKKVLLPDPSPLPDLTLLSDPPLLSDPLPPPNPAPLPDPVSRFSHVIASDDIVYKPGKKKGKKKKKVKFFLGNESKNSGTVPPDPTCIVTETSSDVQMQLQKIKDDNTIDASNLDSGSTSSHTSPNVLNADTESLGSCDSSDKNGTEPSDKALTVNVQSSNDNTTTLDIEVSGASSETAEDPQVEPPTPDIYSSIELNNNNIISHADLNANTALLTDDNVNDHEDDQRTSVCNTTNMALSDSSDDEVPKYGMDWVQYSAPGLIISLSISDSHIFCVDSRNVLYVSEFPVLGFVWRKVQQPAEQVAVSQSEDIIWALYKGTIYAAEKHPSGYWKDMNWVPMARNVLYMQVDNVCGWYISQEGDLITQQPLSLFRPYTYPQSVSCPANTVQVSCKDDIVWVLTKAGKVYCKVENPHSAAEGQLYSTIPPKWKEIKFEGFQLATKIVLCSNHIAIIVDNNGILWFRVGVTPITPEGLNHVWQVESNGALNTSCETRASSVNDMMKSLTKDMFSTFLFGQQESCVAVSNSGVWYCTQMTNTLYCNQKYIIGHSWDIVIPTGSSMKWKMLSCKGISNAEGVVWGCTSAGELFCFSEVSKNPIAVQLPDKAFLKCLEPRLHCLWVLTSNSTIYVRREMSEKCPQGVWWHELNTSQLNDIKLQHMSCSSGSVWACDSDGEVYVRIGSLTPSTNCLMQAWVQVDSDISQAKPNIKKLSAVGKQFPLPLVQPIQHKTILTKVYVGPKEYMVWAIDDRNNVFMRDGITSSLLVGEKWVFVPSPPAKQICISNKAAWLLKSTGEIFRRFGISHKNPAGDYWKEIPGKLSCLSVTYDDYLWGIQQETICQHASYTLDHFKSFSSQTRTESVIEADWEDVMTNFSDDDDN